MARRNQQRSTPDTSAVELDLDKLQRSLGEFSARREALDRRLDELLDEHERVRSTPCPRDEQARAIAESIVTAARDRFRRRCAENFEHHHQRPRIDIEAHAKLEDRGTPALLSVRMPGVMGIYPEADPGKSRSERAHDMTLTLLPDATQRLTAELLATWPDDPERTMPAVERERELQRLDLEIGKVKQLIDDMDAAAEAAGVVFE